MEAIKKVLHEMAEAGFSTMFEERYNDLPENSIEREMWLFIALHMLKSIKFPFELIKICNRLSMMSEKERKDLILSIKG